MNSMDFCMCIFLPQILPVCLSETTTSIHPFIHPVTTQKMSDVNNPQRHTIFNRILFAGKETLANYQQQHRLPTCMLAKEQNIS